MEIAYLICLLRNLYADKETLVRIGHGTMDVSKLGKEHINAIYCPSIDLTYMQNTSC